MSKMSVLPLSKQEKRDEQMDSLGKAFFPEFLLVGFTVVYHVLPMLIWDEMFLISQPIYSTLLFSSIFGIVELVTFCYIWKLCKGELKSETDEIARKPLDTSSDWFKRIAVFVGCFFVSHVICILFGAALTKYVQETATWSLLVASIIAIPNVCVFGSNLEPWYRVIICGKFSNQIEQFLYFQALGVVVGSWASAAVIPLDWDRDWQVWPIPCVMGCLLGYVGAVVCHCVITFKSMKGTKRL